MKTLFKLFGHFSFIHFIIILIILQLLILSLLFLPHDPDSIWFLGIIAIGISWLYFFKNESNRFYKFHRFFPNEKTVKIIIDTLDLYTFNYNDFENEYFDFISKRTYNESEDYYKIPPLFQIAIHRRDISTPEQRSEIAKSISVKDFCVAFELYNLFLEKKDTHREIHFELNPELSFSREEQILRMARLHYHFDFSDYLKKVFENYNYNNIDYNNLERALIEYIHKTFFNNENPSYEKFVDYCVNDYIFINAKHTQSLYEQLKKQQSTILPTRR